MATLKYRNSNGTYIAIPALQGPKGDKGDKGDKGNTGPAGGILDVYESSTKGYITVKNADSTTKNIPVGNPNALLTTGGIMTGALIINNDNSAGQISLFEDGEGGTLTIKSKSGTYQYHVDAYNDEIIRIHTADLNPNGYYKQISWNGKTGALTTDLVYGAVWNDYAEYRRTINNVKPGQVVAENGDGTQHITTKRMEKGCNVVSDTFGFAIGETNECKTPIACAGRALVYTNEDRYSYEPGEPVCSGPNGTISKMSKEEKINHPECIVGYVSEIPEYETWGTGNVAVNSRIWIKVV